jgi:hypothetical protein
MSTNAEMKEKNVNITIYPRNLAMLIHFIFRRSCFRLAGKTMGRIMGWRILPFSWTRGLGMAGCDNEYRFLGINHDGAYLRDSLADAIC